MLYHFFFFFSFLFLSFFVKPHFSFFYFFLSHFVLFISPAVKAKRNAVNFSYNVGRGKLDYPSLFLFFSFLSVLILSPLRYRFRSSFFSQISDFGNFVASSLMLEIFSVFGVFSFFYLFSWRKDGQETRSGGRNSDTRFLFPSLALFLFFSFFLFSIVSRVKRRVEVEKVGLYAFFTRNQEPRSCSGGWVWRGMFTGVQLRNLICLLFRVSCFSCENGGFVILVYSLLH